MTAKCLQAPLAYFLVGNAAKTPLLSRRKAIMHPKSVPRGAFLNVYLPPS